MIVDQVDHVAAPTAHGARRTRRHPAPDHALWPGERPPATAPSVAPGLAGLWPTPHKGSPRTARCVLSADTTSPKAARDFTLATLREWKLEETADDVIVSVSELVTNALRHGLHGLPMPLPVGPIQLVLLGHPRRLVLVVTDPGARPPEPTVQEPTPFGEGGRGLLVVGAVSDAWGWAPLATGGKAVWAAFDLRAGSPA